MKRSEINKHIKAFEALLKEHRFELPPFLSFTPDEWKEKGHEYDEIRDNALGWDITDYGEGHFETKGLYLITLRNGNVHNPKYTKTYAEKIMMLKEGQVSPNHFHWNKMEDIIFREGDGTFCMKLWNADYRTEELIEDGVVRLRLDGVMTEFEPGKTYRLRKGQSVCYTPFIYHTFWAEDGPCLIGEVSMVNDDSADNRFLEPIGRFPDIEEDVSAEVLLCNEYPEL